MTRLKSKNAEVSETKRMHYFVSLQWFGKLNPA